MDTVTGLLIGIGALTLLIVVTAFMFLVYCGLLHNVRVSTGKPPIGQFTGAYKFQKGPYKNVGDLCTEATSINPKLKLFAVYYDDPLKVAAEDLRSAVGSILSENGAEPDPNVAKLYQSHGFKLFGFPATSHAVVTSFPYITGLSIWLATMRVYAAMSAYIREKKLCATPWIDIYGDGKIQYMAVLAKQLEFYVPEAEKPQLESPK